jgi:pyridinium-3,5-bisthiocarboxylic acid mononucleotide nickel chelatase
MARIGWLDCTSGVSGDMLLGALADVGALDALAAALAAAPELGASLDITTTTRGALAARRVEVTTSDPHPPHRGRADVQAIIDGLQVPADVRARAGRVFDRLAAAEADVHGVEASAVQFHEVGAVDAIVDIVGVCLGLHTLGLRRLTVSPIALGGGSAQTQHGAVPVPVPAVLALLRDTTLVAMGGDQRHELATPTGVALLAELADDTTALPGMTVHDVGVGAGSRQLDDRPNVVRLVVGEASGDDVSEWLLTEANVDDLDPRLWPGVLDALLAAGAADAWLTPILMKKGRPAHTVSALTTTGAVEAVRRALFVESSTIGVRTTHVHKSALDREWIEVDVDGQCVRVKVARLEGAVVSVNPEWDDVRAAAAALSRAAKEVLADATSAARRSLG